jgi:hypothetical protein
MINSSSALFVFGSRDVLVVRAQAHPSVTASLINQESAKEITERSRSASVVNDHFHDADHVHGRLAYDALLAGR